MKKNCSRYPPVSRADTGTTLSRRFACRERECRLEDARMEIDSMEENDEGVFLMNRFYGEKTVVPMIEYVKKELAGDIGLLVADRLEKEMRGKNGYIKGDALLELLKEELGLEWAVSLIGRMDRFKKIGLYGDCIVSRLSEPAAGESSFSGSRTRKRQAKARMTDCSGKEKGICRGCAREKTGKEKANWETNAKTK